MAKKRTKADRLQRRTEQLEQRGTVRSATAALDADDGHNESQQSRRAALGHGLEGQPVQILKVDLRGR